MQKNPKIQQIIEKIEGAKSVLVALSSNPSLDEMAAALGLTLMLDKMGKHTTAIYSGETPNALEFLKPAETFEKNTHSLQEFIVALDKEKADHLRYKVDGAFVKIYITPYKTNITKDDLEFSRGDCNVDLVIAMNVLASKDLDGALAEHGRILHNATTINIAAGAAGRFGEIEWNETRASSVSEMVFSLVNELKEQTEGIGKDVATALLTGIVAATNRFSNEKTMPQTMTTAARLMAAGADQQLVSANIPVSVVMTERREVSGSNLDGEAGEEKGSASSEASDSAGGASEEIANEPVDARGGIIEGETSTALNGKESEAAGTETSVVVNVAEAKPVEEEIQGSEEKRAGGLSEDKDKNTETVDGGENFEIINDGEGEEKSSLSEKEEGGKDFGKMMDEALAEELPGEGEDSQTIEQEIAEVEGELERTEGTEGGEQTVPEVASGVSETVNAGAGESETVAPGAVNDLNNVSGVNANDVPAEVQNGAVMPGVGNNQAMPEAGNGQIMAEIPNMTGVVPDPNLAPGVAPMAPPAMVTPMDGVAAGAMMNAPAMNAPAMNAPMDMSFMQNAPVVDQGMTPIMPQPGITLPPPAPPIDFNAMPLVGGGQMMMGAPMVDGSGSAMPSVPPQIIMNQAPMVAPIEPATPKVPEDSLSGMGMLGQTDPGAFKIPGM